MMKKKIFLRRFPTYLVGASFGILIVLFVQQMKKAFAPEFYEMALNLQSFDLVSGASVKLELGENPGHTLIWGFPTKLAVGKMGENGKIRPLQFFEYKNLVEPTVSLGPFSEQGSYQISGQFYVCTEPGEKFCGLIQLRQDFQVKESGETLRTLNIPIRDLAFQAKAEGEKKTATQQTSPEEKPAQ